MEEIHRARLGKGHGASMPIPGESPQVSTCSSTWKLFEPCPLEIFLEASLHRPDWLNHWPLAIKLNLQPHSPPRRAGARLIQPSNHTVDSPGNQPHPLVQSKNHLT